MNTSKSNIEAIILKTVQGRRLSKKEQATWNEWSSNSQNHRELPRLFRDPKWLRKQLNNYDKIQTEVMWDNVMRQYREENDEAALAPMAKWWTKPVRILVAVSRIAASIIVGI